MATYLSLTNDAIFQAGIDVDELDASSFDALSASSGDPMARRMKKWVQQAWREIQLERNEWEFLNKQGQIIIYPRILVVDGDRSVAPPADSTFEGDTTGATFTVLSTTLLDGTWAGGDAVAWIDFESLVGNFMFNELYDETAPTAANLDVFRIKWFGRYDLQTEVTDLLEPNLDTFTIQYPAGMTDSADDVNSVGVNRLEYVPWSQWVVGMENEQTFDMPRFFTTTPDGYYDFYPRPNGPYVLSFEYTAEPQELSLAADTITGLPAQYVDMIMWRAVMYYADYDSKPQIFQRAERRYESYKNKMEKNQMPVFNWGFNRFAMKRI